MLFYFFLRIVVNFVVHRFIRFLIISFHNLLWFSINLRFEWTVFLFLPVDYILFIAIPILITVSSLHYFAPFINLRFESAIFKFFLLMLSPLFFFFKFSDHCFLIKSFISIVSTRLVKSIGYWLKCAQFLLWLFNLML